MNDVYVKEIMKINHPIFPIPIRSYLGDFANSLLNIVEIYRRFAFSTECFSEQLGRVESQNCTDFNCSQQKQFVRDFITNAIALKRITSAIKHFENQFIKILEEELDLEKLFKNNLTDDVDMAFTVVQLSLIHI